MNEEFNKKFELNFLGRKLIVETGWIGKQANSAVLVRYGDTVVLSAAVMGKNPIEQDFFPLTVVYNEKFYSVGKIPGGFIKREGRPSENAVLAGRIIDRPIRPLFDENFRNEVQVINTVMSVDKDCSPEMTALFASSLALGISDIPFEGPVAGVMVGKIGKELIINPSADQLDESVLTLTVAGTEDAINMVEAGSKEVSESEMLEALMLAHKNIEVLTKFQKKIIKQIGKEKVQVVLASVDPSLEDMVRKFATTDMLEAIQIKDKLEKYSRIDEVKENTIKHFENIYANIEDADINKILADVKKVVDQIEGDEVRRLITDKKIRPDGRKMDEIRDLNASIDLLPRTHGSAVFTRGQTQVIATTTLGAIGEHQILDGLCYIITFLHFL